MPQGFVNLRGRLIEKDEEIENNLSISENKEIIISQSPENLSTDLSDIDPKIIELLKSKLPFIILKRLNFPLVVNQIKNKMSEELDENFMLKIIPSFNGNAKEFHKFCTCAEIVWNPLKAKNDKSLFLNIIKSKLCDQAYEVVRYTKFESWNDLKLALERKFIQRRSQGTVSSKLVQLNQLKNENVRSFADKVEQLLNELNEICIEKQGIDSARVIYALNESTALNSFQGGLQEPLRTIVKANNFTTLSQAIERALDEEISHKPLNLYCSFCKTSTHNTKNCYRNKNSNNNSHNASQPSTSFNNSHKKSDNQTEQLNNSDNNAPKKFCNYCKKRGHLVKDCFRLENKKHSNANASNSTEIKTIEQNEITGNIIEKSENNNSGNLAGSEQIQLISVRIDQL